MTLRILKNTFNVVGLYIIKNHEHKRIINLYFVFCILYLYVINSLLLLFSSTDIRVQKHLKAT